MAISVDVVISGKTTTSVEGTASSAVVTTNLQEDKLGTKGGIISGSIIPNQNDAIDLGSPSKRFLNLYAKTAHLAADSLKLGDEATISAGPGGGFSFDTDGETIFGDIKVRNLTVTGTQSVISSTDLAVKDNIIIINSGEAGAGITLTSGGLVVDRGTLENATILFNDDTDRFELNFPISVDGSELAIVPNLITTGQTLQGQILTNDTDIANLTTNLASTGNLLTTNLNSTGTTLAANLNSTGTTVATNLVTSGQYLTSEVSTLSGLSVFHSMTGNFATHIKDLDDVTLAGNQGKYLKVNSAGDGIAYDIPPVTGVGGEGGGAVKFTGLVDAPNDYSSLQTEFPANGGLVAVNSASESLVYLNSGVFATDHDLITTGNTLNSQRDALSGDLISTGNALDAARDTLSGNLITTGTALTNTIISTGNHLDSLRDTLSGNLISSGNTLNDKRDTLSGNLISTGNNLQSQITNNDTDISALQLATGEIQNVKFNKTGGTISGEILPNASGTINLGSPSLPFRSGHFDDLIVSSDSIKIGSEATLSSPPEGGIKFDTTGTIAFGDVSIKNLTVTGTRTIVETTDTAIKDNIILLNSGEDGAGITLNSGGLVIDRGSATDANILFNDSTDHFEVNFPLAVEGSLAVKQNQTGIFAEAANLVTTGQTLQTQIISNDGDISTLTSNLASTGNTLTSNVSTLTTNLASTGSTLATDIVTVSGLTQGNATDLATLTSNLATTGQTLTSEISTVSGLVTSNDSDISTLTSNLVTTGQTLQTQITSNDSDISTLTSNLGTTGQTLQTQIISNDSDISTLTSNLATTGQTLQTQITSNDTDISTLTSNITSTGDTLDTKIDTLSGVVTLDSETGNLVDTSMTGSFAVNFLDLDDTPGSLGAVGQSVVVNADRDGLIFSGVSAGGGGGSSTFVGLSDTPGALTASRLLAVNSAGNSVEFLESGTLVTDAETGVFATSANLVTTGQTLTTNTNTVSSNLVSTGSVVDDVSGNLITTGQTLQAQITSNDSDTSTLTSNLVTTGQTLTTNINTVATNLGTSGQTLQTQITSNDSDISTLTNNLGTTGQTLQTQITSNDSDIASLTTNLVTTGQTLQTQIISNDSDITTLTSNLVSTGTIVDDISGNLTTTGQTLQTQILSNDSDISTLTTNLGTTGQTLQTQIISNDSDISTLDSTTVKLTSNQTIAGNKTFSDTVTIGDLNVTGTQTTITATNLAIKDNLIEINSGEAGAGITLVSGGITINRGSATNANILFNDSTDRFELNFPLATDGSLVATAPNLITTGQTLQTQIISNDSDISTLTTNLGTTGQTIQTQIISNDSDISTLTTNLGATGQTLQTQIISNDSDISTLTSNLATTGQTLTNNINTVSTNLGTSGQTLQNQIISNDSDIATLTTNLGTTGQTLQTQITSNDGDITTLTSNLVTTGQTLQTQITSNDGDITTLTSNLITTGQTLTSEISTLSGLATLDSETGSLIDTSMTGNFTDGAGVAGYVARWSDSNTLTSGTMQDNGAVVGVNQAADPDNAFSIKSIANNTNPLQIAAHDGDSLFVFRQTAGDGRLSIKKDGGTETVRLDSDNASFMTGGNVGIGIAAPTTKLHISYPAVGQDGSAVTSLTTTTALNLGLKLGFSGGANSNNNIIGGISLGNSGEEFAGMYALDGGASAATDLALFVGTTGGIIEAVKIDSSGSVGIGTNAPASKLHLYSATDANTIVKLQGGSDSAKGAHINFLRGATDLGSFGTKASLVGGTSNDLMFYSASNDFIYYSTAERMRVQADGKVGIGTNAPAKSLQISAGDGSHLMLHYSGSGHSSGAVRQFFQRSTGTEASPTGTSDGDIIGTTSYVAYAPSGSSYRNSAAIVVTRYGAANTVSAPAKIAFATPGASDDTLVDRLTILPGGKIGIGATNPSVDFQVGNSVSGETKVVTFNSEGGAEVGLRVKSRTNRAKLAVSDNDTTAYIVAEGGARGFGPQDTAHANNLIVNSDGNVGVGTITPSKKFHVVGDIEISGTIYQSGSVFEGGGGGGGGSSTFVGLSDTPGSLTANRVLTVNAAGNAVETTYNTSTLSGHQSVEQGYFTGLTLGGTGTGILQNASGTISNLDLADNKFDVSVIEERDTNVGDANFSDVSLLLPFDGANEATSTSDSSDSGRTITLNSNVELSTTQSKFGGTSLYIPGSSSACQIGGDFSFTGDFTIEFWEYIDTRYNDSISIGFNASSTNYVWHSILYGYYNAGTKIKLYSSSNGSSWNIANAVEVGDKLDDQWVHRALVRSGSTWYSFQNGTEYWSADLGNNALNTASQYHWLGRGYNSTSNRTNEGYYDDVRVTLGVARYTSDFTVPSAAFPTSQNITAAKYVGQIGGIDDTDVDYGIEKLSNSQLMIKKLSDNTFTPDRLYVNVNKLGALGHGIAFDQVYTGDGTTTNYLLSEDVSNARDVLVSVEGLIQTPIIDYTLAGATGVSFTTGVVSGHEISFRHLALGPSGTAGPSGADGADGASADISYLTERFTGNGVVSGFEMSRSISTADEIFVFVNGLVQDSGANFSVTAGTGLYFTDGEIVSGDKIMVRHIY
tara:strand:+ start:6714 stop:14408 length:7695 start_codon:yes stop_codon:yes gene_type:complete